MKCLMYVYNNYAEGYPINFVMLYTANRGFYILSLYIIAITFIGGYFYISIYYAHILDMKTVEMQVCVE